MMFVNQRPYADPDVAAHKLVAMANRGNTATDQAPAVSAKRVT
jgi:hypothetical protein